jgi:hypothetical protein
MRFTKSWCPRPPWGRGRARPGRKYRMSENAVAQRRRNLRIWRERGHLWRLESESQAIKRLIWQWVCEPVPKLSVRALARRLRVWPSYVRSTRDKAQRDGVDTQLRATWDELARARELTNLGREKAPELFTPQPPRRALCPSNWKSRRRWHRTNAARHARTIAKEA